MSIERKEIVTCPKCKCKGEAVVWDTLNTHLDPQTKADLLDGKLFTYVCPHCKEQFSFGFDMLYHQVEDNTMIQLAHTPEAAQSAAEQFDGFLDEGLAGINVDRGAFTFRIVADQNELREKILILDSHLDDRAVEIMKILARAQIYSQDPSADVDLMFFNINDKGFEFTVKLSDGRWGSYPFNQGVYDMVVEEIVSKLEPDLHDYFINAPWAVKKLEK